MYKKRHERVKGRFTFKEYFSSNRLRKPSKKKESQLQKSRNER